MLMDTTKGIRVWAGIDPIAHQAQPPSAGAHGAPRALTSVTRYVGAPRGPPHGGCSTGAAQQGVADIGSQIFFMLTCA